MSQEDGQITTGIVSEQSRDKWGDEIVPTSLRSTKHHDLEEAAAVASAKDMLRVHHIDKMVIGSREDSGDEFVITVERKNK